MTRWSIASGVMLIGVVVLSSVQQPARTTWSPDYRISEHEAAGGVLALFVNGIPHQGPLARRPTAAGRLLRAGLRRVPGPDHDNVLIVGAGSGPTSRSRSRTAPSTSTRSRSTQRSSSSGSSSTRIGRTTTRG